MEHAQVSHFSVDAQSVCEEKLYFSAVHSLTWCGILVWFKTAVV